MNPEKKALFEKYFNEHYQHIYQYILKRVINHHTAEDLAMDAFFTCYQKLDSFDPEKASFGTWIYVVVANKLKNFYRDQKQHDDVDECVIPLDSFENSFLAAEYLSDMRKALADALQTLSETQREVVVQSYFQNKSSGEIALALDLTAGNVRVLLTRAVKKLRAYFEEHQIKWEL